MARLVTLTLTLAVALSFSVGAPPMSAQARNQAQGRPSVAERIESAWAPDCTPGVRVQAVRVSFVLDAEGKLVGLPTSFHVRSPDPVVRKAAESAISAVTKAAPFSGLPREFYGTKVSMTLNSDHVCERRNPR